MNTYAYTKSPYIIDNTYTCNNYGNDKNGTVDSKWSFLIFSIVGFIVFIAFYLVFLYIPAVEYENEFDTLLDTANDTLATTRQYANTVEEYTKFANDTYADICSNIDTPIQGLPVTFTYRDYLGSSLDNFCQNLSDD